MASLQEEIKALLDGVQGFLHSIEDFNAEAATLEQDINNLVIQGDKSLPSIETTLGDTLIAIGGFDIEVASLATVIPASIASEIYRSNKAFFVGLAAVVSRVASFLPASVTAQFANFGTELGRVGADAAGFYLFGQGLQYLGTQLNALAASTPEVTAPSTETATAGQSIPINGVSIGETAAFGTAEKFKLTLSANAGMINLTDSSGIVQAGSNTTATTLYGTLAQVNADLSTLSYTAASTPQNGSIKFDLFDYAGKEATATTNVTVNAPSSVETATLSNLVFNSGGLSTLTTASGSFTFDPATLKILSSSVVLNTDGNSYALSNLSSPSSDPNAPGIYNLATTQLADGQTYSAIILESPDHNSHIYLDLQWNPASPGTYEIWSRSYSPTTVQEANGAIDQSLYSAPGSTLLAGTNEGYLQSGNLIVTGPASSVSSTQSTPTATTTSSATAASANDPVITQSGATISGDGSETYSITGNALSENIGASNASPVFISGTGNTVNLSAAASNFAVTDEGQGTVLDLANFAATANSTITVSDFQLDQTGSIILPDLYATAASAVAALQSDGHSGSILSLGNGTSLDFVSDNSLTTANFRVASA